MPGYEFFRLLMYFALAWLVGQPVLVLAQPFLFLARRLVRDRQQQAGEAGETGETGEAGPEMTRRAFLANALAVIPFSAFGVSGGAVYRAQTAMTVRRHALAMPGLPAGLRGFKIGQISDTHVGPYFDLARLEETLELLAREKPDLVAVTGDFADDMALLRPAAERLGALARAVPLGVYFCMGNHEYFRDTGRIRAELTQSGVKVLIGASALIAPGPPPFYLLGVDYPLSAGRGAAYVDVGRRRRCFAAATGSAPPDAFKVLIAHHPDFLIDGFAARIPLTLAGHTHGGQVVIGGQSLLALHAYVRGLYRENGVYGYVSSGAGHWFPFRLGCPPEVSVFMLQ